MGFLGKLFGGNKTEKKKEISLSKQSGVPYNEGLIKTLLDDHQRLLAEFGKIMNFAQKNRSKLIKQYLKTFKLNLEIHNYSEKIQLYTYLENYYKDDPDKLEVIRDLDEAAQEIFKNVFSFIKRYENIDFDKKSCEQFLNEWKTLGGILQSRISIEESELYTLYKK